jgi:hypothetical protein
MNSTLALYAFASRSGSPSSFAASELEESEMASPQDGHARAPRGDTSVTPSVRKNNRISAHRPMNHPSIPAL